MQPLPPLLEAYACRGGNGMGKRTIVGARGLEPPNLTDVNRAL